MENLQERQKEALRLVERLIELEPDIATTQYAHKMRERLKLPMTTVLDRMQKLHPDLTIVDISDKLGVSRQAYYSWLNGVARPTAKVAKKLAGYTGFDAKDIRGQLPPWRAVKK